MLELVEGYLYEGDFVEKESLPNIKIGDMVGYKFGIKGKKYEVTCINHRFYKDKETGQIKHWMSFGTNYSKARTQGNWAIVE